MNSDDTARALNELAQAAHTAAVGKGWYTADGRNSGELIALVHSELSELLEALRDGNRESQHLPGYNQAEEEAADVVIRLLDMCAYHGWRIGPAVIAKMAYNTTRPARHGKAF